MTYLDRPDNETAQNIDPEGIKWPWMQTYTGIAFYPGHPRAEDVNLRDIAVALSRESRYAGHTKEFYSVAQHSVLVSYYVPKHLALWGLLHDASEAYVKDLPYPLKRLLPQYKVIEKNVMRVIAEKFHLSWPEPAEVKAADNLLLVTERRDLMNQKPRPWRAADLPEPLAFRIVPWSSKVAENAFLARFEAIQDGAA